MENEAFFRNPSIECWNSSPSSDPPAAGDRNDAFTPELIGQLAGICNESSPLPFIYQSSDSSSFSSSRNSCTAGKDAAAAASAAAAGCGGGRDLGRKRKEATEGSEMENPSPFTLSSGTEPPEILEEEYSNSKRAKHSETTGVEKDSAVQAEEEDGSAVKKIEKEKATTKLLESPQFLYVRARRGQATDSHSLAERVRRGKISERMKFLHDLVPGCNKVGACLKEIRQKGNYMQVAGKALMLDEIINYVQSLQLQVEFLSLKLATVSLPFDVNYIYATSSSSAFEEPFLGASLMAEGGLELQNGRFLVDDLHDLVQMSFQNP